MCPFSLALITIIVICWTQSVHSLTVETCNLGVTSGELRPEQEAEHQAKLLIKKDSEIGCKRADIYILPEAGFHPQYLDDITQWMTYWMNKYQMEFIYNKEIQQQQQQQQPTNPYYINECQGLYKHIWHPFPTKKGPQSPVAIIYNQQTVYVQYYDVWRIQPLEADAYEIPRELLHIHFKPPKNMFIQILDLQTNQKINVLGVHLQADTGKQRKTDPTEFWRELQLKFIFGRINSFLAMGHRNWIIAGDFNDKHMDVHLPSFEAQTSIGAVQSAAGTNSNSQQQGAARTEQQTFEIVHYEGVDYIVVSQEYLKTVRVAEREPAEETRYAPNVTPGHVPMWVKFISKRPEYSPQLRAYKKQHAQEQTSTGPSATSATASNRARGPEPSVISGTASSTETGTGPSVTAVTTSNRATVPGTTTSNTATGTTAQTAAHQSGFNYYGGNIDYFQNKEVAMKQEQLSMDYNRYNSNFNFVLLLIIAIMLLSCLGCLCICICWIFAYLTTITVQQKEWSEDTEYHRQIELGTQ